MNVRRPIFSGIALCTSLLLAVPADVAAQAAQPAGKITTVLPIVNVVRGPQQIAANTSQEVFWGDVINTGHLARARIALTDGSILSVGSDSNLTIAKHDPAGQQTDLDLNYGQVRARAVKLVKPDAHFRVRTPVGVAGVVGTELIVQLLEGLMQVFCMEGTCQVCDLALNCVLLKGGEVSSIRSNQPPSQPQPPTPANLTSAVNATSPAGGAGAGAAGAGGAAGGGIGAAGGAVVGVSAAVAAAVATVVVRSVATTKTCSPPPPTGGAALRANCVSRTGIGRLPGQR